MFKLLLPIFPLMLFFAAPTKGHCSTEERFKYAITNLTVNLLYQQSINNPGMTFATSAFPLLAAWGHLYDYSKGLTKEQILSVLGLNNDDKIHSIIRSVLERFNTQRDVTSRLGFKAFANSCDPFSDVFSESFNKYLDGETQNIDYSNPEHAAKIINDCANNQTSTSRGENIITRDNIPSGPGILYVIFQEFKVNWNHPLNPKRLQDIKFKVSSNEVIPMKALCGEGLLGYALIDKLDGLMLELKMKGDDYTAVIIIPNTFEGLKELMDRLRDIDVLYESINKLKPRCMSICIPLGEVNTVVDIKKELQQVHPTNIFDDSKAELCDITQGKDKVYISSIMQQIHINGYSGIDENSNTNNMTSKIFSSLCPDAANLPARNLDNPFVYFIMDKQLNIPITSGLFFRST